MEPVLRWGDQIVVPAYARMYVQSSLVSSSWPNLPWYAEKCPWPDLAAMGNAKIFFRRQIPSMYRCLWLAWAPALQICRVPRKLPACHVSFIFSSTLLSRWGFSRGQSEMHLLAIFTVVMCVSTYSVRFYKKKTTTRWNNIIKASTTKL